MCSSCSPASVCLLDFISCSLVCFKTHTLRSKCRHGEGSDFVPPFDYGDGEVDHVDELVLDEHVGFTVPLLDKLLSKGLNTIKSIPSKFRLGFSRVLKGDLDKSIANAIRSWGNPGGSLKLVSEALAEPSLLWSNVDEENLDLGEQNVKQCKRRICDGHYIVSIRVLSSSGVEP
ncbi:hypothetical protein Tco_0155554 [Tanacetum coccineum]